MANDKALKALRSLMAADGISAVIIPQTDPHLGEYIADHWQVRRYLSGFTGSAGTLVVTADAALLWVDSRYFLQGAQQLQGSGIQLMKEGLPGTPTILEWLVANLPAGSTVGIDGMLMSIAQTDQTRQALAAHGISLDTSFTGAGDPRVWPDRPSLPQDPIYVHDIKYAGASAKDKIHDVLEVARGRGAQAVFISALDEVAWILNIRSNDVTDNPVATAFLYLSADGRGDTLFTDPAKLTADALAHLKDAGVSTAPYGYVLAFLAALPAGERVLVSATQTAGTVRDTLGSRAVVSASPAALLKAVKNSVQVQGIRQAMLRDGVAMVQSLCEIETRVVADGETLTEMDVDRILTRNRKAQPLYVENSFATIAGYGPHGAIVHYSATPETASTLAPGNLLLIDSGAQYLDGTTDITRTISLGEPTRDQRRDFTLVMKGHIALAQAVFPEGTRGNQLDVLARMFLWDDGKTYLHGTGHGVGQFLNVHEGPQRIHMAGDYEPLAAGMLTSDEPGLYLADRYGIRCENLVLTVPKMETEYGRFLAFEVMTLCPFDLQLFLPQIMTDGEIQWVNDYHARVREALLPLLDNDLQVAWLMGHTQELTR